jgi:hypothetical protein
VVASAALPDDDGSGEVELTFVSPPAVAAGLSEIEVTVWSNTSRNASNASGAAVARLSAPFLLSQADTFSNCVTGCVAAAAGGAATPILLAARTTGPALGSVANGQLELDCVLADVPGAHNTYCAAAAAAIITFAALCDGTKASGSAPCSAKGCKQQAYTISL